MKNEQATTTNVAENEKIFRSSIDNTKDTQNVNIGIEKGSGSQSSVREKVPAEKHHLNQRDYNKHVIERGIEEDWVKANCRSVDTKGAADWLYGNEKLAKDIPYTGIIIEGANGQGQYRPDTAYRTKSMTKKDKVLKYHSRPREEYDIMLPIHPDDKYFWDFSEEIKQNYCYTIQGNPYLILTEGLFKAMVGMINGFATVAVKGVEMGLTPKSADPQERRYVVNGLEELCKEGFGFIIAFDADLAQKEGVRDALHTLGFKLSKLTSVLICGGWDEADGKGMDDFIKNKGIEEFRECLQRSITFENWDKAYKKAQSEAKAEKERGTQGAIVDELITQNRNTLKYHAKHKEWYQYEAELKGVWSPIDEQDVLAICYQECKKQKGVHATNGLTVSVRNTLRHELRESKWIINPDYICLEDCVVNIHTLKPESHSPGFRFLNQRPYKWSDRELGIKPIEEFLLFANWGHSDRVQLFRAAFKATITARGASKGIHRFIEMVGSGGSGKGTILSLLTELVGKEATITTDFTQLQNNRFETANIYGKLALIISDAEQYSGDMSTFKAVTGGDNLRNEKKGIQQGEPIRFDGLAWVAANSAIASKEYTSGMFRRRIPVPMTRSVKPEDQKDLQSKFRPHLASFLEWVLQMSDDEMTSYLKNTQKMIPSLNEFSEENLLATNPFAAWLQENVIYSPNVVSRVGNKNSSAEDFLFPNYCLWAEANGYKPVSMKKFSETVVDLVQNQLRLSSSIYKGKDRKGAYITELMLRRPGDNYTPLPFGDVDKSAEEIMSELNEVNSYISTPQKSECDGLVTDKTGSVMGRVTGETIGSEGCDGCDGLKTVAQSKGTKGNARFPLHPGSIEVSKVASHKSYSSQPFQSKDSSRHTIHHTNRHGDGLGNETVILPQNQSNFEVGDRVKVKQSWGISPKLYEVVGSSEGSYFVKEVIEASGELKGKQMPVSRYDLLKV